MEAESQIQQIQKTFKVSGYSEGHKVPFTMYIFEDKVSFQWEIVERLLIANREETILWNAFAEAFYKKYISETVRYQKEAKFIFLEQGSMFVAAYEASLMITNEPASFREG